MTGSHATRRSAPPQVAGRLVPLALVLALLVTWLTACTAGGLPPAPTEAAETPDRVIADLAAGLTSKDVTGVAFVGSVGSEVTKSVKALVAGMGGSTPTVTVARVVSQGSSGTGTLRITWSLAGTTQQWNYESTAGVVRENGQWKVSWQPSIVHQGLTGDSRLQLRRTQAPRGELLGADGDAIVRLRPVVRIGIDKAQVPGSTLATSARRLAKLVSINQTMYAAKVAAAGPQAFVEALVVRAESKDRPTNASVFAIKGALPIQTEQMLAPSREFARAIIGTVGEATREIVAASKGTVVAGDAVGLSGLERRYDSQLRGTPGIRVQLVPGPGQTTATPSTATPSPSTPSPQTPSGSATVSPAPTPAASVTLFETRPVAGRALRTTLSIPLQKLAESVLAKARPASAIVAIQPSTGALVVAADGPGSNGRSDATVGQYAPGSTFKVATSLALLRAGLTPTSEVTCPATIAVDGRVFRNYSEYPPSHRGRIPLRAAVAQSCNTAFIGQREKLASSSLADAAASLGLGLDYDVGFASFFGSVPPTDSATSQAASMIGQAGVQVSPMAMASVAASVSAGHTVLPHLIADRVVSAKAKPLTKIEAGQLRDLMRAVVTDGSGRFLLRLGGPPVIAKTGTAEFGSQKPLKTHAWMIAAQGDLAVAVFVGDGRSGSRTAGPLLARFLAAANP